MEKFLPSPQAYAFMFPPDAQQKMIDMIARQTFPTIAGLTPAVLFAILFSLVRFILQETMLSRTASYFLHIKYIPQKLEPVIENAFLDGKKYELSDVKQFCSKQDIRLNESFVSNYLFNRRKNNSCKKRERKFGEAVWRFIFYALFCVLGYFALRPCKEEGTRCVPELAIWVRDTSHHWKNWPLHPMSTMLSFYYQIELGCYIHQLFWTEVKRSDAMEMILHHLATIALVVTSYLTNFTRVGASILLLHDVADVFLESAKFINYISLANKGQAWLRSLCDGLFVCFASTFFVTRLYFFPRYIIGSVLFEAPEEFGTKWTGYWVFTGLLVTLQCLHIFWFYLIAKMIFKLVATNHVDKDERSDSEEEDEGENPKETKKSH